VIFQRYKTIYPLQIPILIIMRNTAKAYLKTEGKLGYRDCEICYYTYNLDNAPNKYLVNVNVCIQPEPNNYIKSLAINECFDKDEEAINYGIVQGKKFIDQSYELGKVKIVKPTANNKKPDTQPKPSKPEKPKSPQAKKT